MESPHYRNLIPIFEHERLEALRPYRVLGAPSQLLFNDFVGVVAKLFEVPIALVSLVREDDVVFVGNEGLSGVEVARREDSLCSVAILKTGLTVFEDLVGEPCGLVNPAAARQLRLHFYAGHALNTPSGQPVGTLCIIDRKSRQMNRTDGFLLTQLAAVAQHLLQLQLALVANDELAPAVRRRLDGHLQASFARMGALTERREWQGSAFAGPGARSKDARNEEARHLASVLHRELKAALAQVQSLAK